MTGRTLDFEAIYDEHFDFVFRNVRRLGVPDAHVDDAVQEVFLVVHRRLAEFEGRSSVKTWIFGVLARVAADHRRSIRRKSPHWRSPGGVVEPGLRARRAKLRGSCERERRRSRSSWRWRRGSKRA